MKNIILQEFLKHLYESFWWFIVKEREFRSYFQYEESPDFTPEDFYADNVPLLLEKLKKNKQFEQQYSKVVGYIGKDLRNPIMDFMGWYSNNKNCSGSDIFNGVISLSPISNLKKLVLNTPMPEIIYADIISDKLELIYRILEKFDMIVRPLLKRKHKKTSITISDEYDIQDLLHVILKSHLLLVKPEEVVPSSNRTYLKIDFLVPGEKLAIECKHIRNSRHAKNFSKEINDDIQSYKNHKDVKRLVFFIYDDNKFIEDPDALEKDYKMEQSFGKKRLNVYLKVKQ